MSASDAAPLPRLGEVFFDVRGNSRSMRLSWYADTGIAVFSIWQGGRCTGTFRLPIDDLPRMIEILQRGPDRRRPRLQAADRPAGSHAPEPEAHSESAGYARADGDFAAGQYQPAAGQYQDAEGYQAPHGYQAGDAYQAGSGQDPADGYQTAAYQRGEPEEAPRGAHSGARGWFDEFGDDRGSPDSRAGYGESPARHADVPMGYGDAASEYEESPAGYQDSASDYQDSPAGYPGSADGYGDAAGYRGPTSGRRGSRRRASSADYSGGTERQSDSWWQEEQDSYPAQPGGAEALADTQLASYGQDRFVPPYVRAQDDGYLNDNQGAGTGHRRAARRSAYPADHGEDSAEQDPYADHGWPDSGYSGGSDYR
jgi:hypothetical protein